MRTPRNIAFSVLLGCFLLFWTSASQVHAGTLEFHANGEELATEGFLAPKLTKDGWALTFSHIFITLADITAYQADPPYDPHQGGPITAKSRVVLQGTHTIDLAADAGEDSRILVGEIDAPAGHYNAVSWRMATAEEGASTGYSMVLMGKAEKEGKIIDFALYSNELRTYRCGEFVGDERKGFLQENGKADLEMTFHLDHIFGRADKPVDDEMNTQAPGFAPFSDGAPRHVIELQGLHIGHAGEGHCSVEWH